MNNNNNEYEIAQILWGKLDDKKKERYLISKPSMIYWQGAWRKLKKTIWRY